MKIMVIECSKLKHGYTNRQRHPLRCRLEFFLHQLCRHNTYHPHRKDKHQAAYPRTVKELDKIKTDPIYHSSHSGQKRKEPIAVFQKQIAMLQLTQLGGNIMMYHPAQQDGKQYTQTKIYFLHHYIEILKSQRNNIFFNMTKLLHAKAIVVDYTLLLSRKQHFLQVRRTSVKDIKIHFLSNTWQCTDIGMLPEFPFALITY